MLGGRGWVTGHSYIVYGPLMNAGHERECSRARADYPDKNIWWDLCERYGVTIFYNRADGDPRLHQVGRGVPAKHDLSSLRLLGSVGEPINPKAWLWYHKVIGGERCPIVDTWWQTETGNIMITPLPGITATKPGSATTPFPASRTRGGRRAGQRRRHRAGAAHAPTPWPGMLRTLYKDDDRFVETYFSKFGSDVYFVATLRAATRTATSGSSGAWTT